MNTVRKPSSLRMGPTYFMAAWYFCANIKQKPASSRSFRHSSGSCWMFTPSASRQSAVPERDEAARLPCLATLTPPAATTMAAVVEMLKEWAPSPPVPTISRTSMPGCGTGVASDRIA